MVERAVGVVQRELPRAAAVARHRKPEPSGSQCGNGALGQLAPGDVLIQAGSVSRSSVAVWPVGRSTVSRRCSVWARFIITRVSGAWPSAGQTTRTR